MPALAQTLAPLLSAAPMIAAGAAAAGLIYSMIQSKHGGEKVGGFAQTGQEAGRYYTPSQADATLQQILEQQTKGYDDLVKALGGTAGAHFALGYDTDPRGTAGNRVTAGVYVGGQSVYSALNVGAGKDDAALQAELQVQAKRMLLAALQASDLPVQISRLLNSVSAAAAGKEQIDAILQAAQAVGLMTDALATLADPMTAASKALEASGATALDAWEKQRDALYELANAAPNTADGLASVTAATQEFAQSTVALLSGIMDAKRALDSMFESTRQTISAAGKSPDQLYAEEQARAQRLFEQLQTATDPEQINSIARQIDESINRAFGMLSPEEQVAHQQEFLDGLDRVQRATDERLQAAMDRVAEQSKTDQQFMSSKLDQILSGLSGAVSDFSSAVDTFAGAAGRSNAPVVNAPSDLRGARQTNFA